jgi:TonB family protein
MNSFLGLENIPVRIESSPESSSHRTPRLLLELEPRGRSFLHNLADFLLRRRPTAFATTSPPAPFWPDVFVTHRLPWGAFAESFMYHAIVIAMAWGLTTLFARHPQVAQQRPFDPADVIYYSPLEYLPPLDTGSTKLARPQKGEPEFAKQPILSVPPESDNRHQTIVTAPDIKLTHDVQTPNVIAWGSRTVPVPFSATERTPAPLPALPNQIVAPVPQLDQAAQRNLASLSQPIVAPPPEVDPRNVRAVASLVIDVIAPAPDPTSQPSRRAPSAPQPSVVEPPPALNSASARRLGDIHIAPSEVIAPAPKLPVSAQRTLPTLRGSGNANAVVPPPPALDAASGATGAGSSRTARGRAALEHPGQQVVPPPPSIPGAHSSDSGGRVIALGIHPSIALPTDLPQGNRRGTFSATPGGKPGASGTPDIRGDNSAGTDGDGLPRATNRNGAGTDSHLGVPPGLHVGAPAQPPTSPAAGGTPSSTNSSGSAGDPNGTIASAVAPPKPAVPPASASASARAPKVTIVDNPSPLEQQVFAGRRLYSMTLNMPNLNSAGGSWVIRFAELNSSGDKGELTAPIAEHKVDPAYPIQLMRENVSGTVTLRAVIKNDGSVSNIRVVNGADQRLDRYAAQAFSRWHFLPATKNGATIDVEAIVLIPFRPILKNSPF